MNKLKKSTDPFFKHRQTFKGVFVVTKTPQSTKVVAKALDYKTLENELRDKGLEDKPVAIQYLEPKGAICAYRISLSFKTNS